MYVRLRRAVRRVNGDPCGRGRPGPQASTGRIPRTRSPIEDVTGADSRPSAGLVLDGWDMQGAQGAAVPTSRADPSFAPLPCLVMNQPPRPARPLWLNAGSGALLVMRARTSTG